jgi:two-component system response regulator
VKVLLVEDNPLDARLMSLALRKVHGWPTEVIVAADGDTAVDVLTANSDSGTSPVDMVILDLNIPKSDGIEVLQLIRSIGSLHLLPVVVASSSPEDISEDILRTANLEADGYIMKPADTDEFLALGEVIQSIYNSAPVARQRTNTL